MAIPVQTETEKLAQELQALLERYEAQVRQVREDRTLNTEQQAAFIERVHSTAHRQASWLASRILGEWRSASEPLEPGSIRKELDFRSKMVTFARGEGDRARPGSYWQRLEYESQPHIIGATIGSFRNIGEATAWYEQAGDVERRALAQGGHSLLIAKFGDGPIGSLLARMKRDLESETSPNLQEALDRQLEAGAICGEAYQICQRAKLILEDGSPFVGIDMLSRLVGRWSASYTFEDMSQPNPKAIWTLTERAPALVGSGT